ncbi:DUF4817 domain-containing protein [Trichonephila clavipes]|nr:DUF4817 domain-containing protein [Trichonephila clavipes]
MTNSQSSRYWRTTEWPDGSTGGCNTAPGRRNAEVSTLALARPVLWPPNSPNLRPLEFSPLGYLKELVYRDVVTTQMNLVACLHAACTSVLRRVMTAIPRRAQACLDLHGGHFEHLS